MATLEEAEEIVRRLTMRNGHLETEMMDNIGAVFPNYRRTIDRNWFALENTAAHPIKV